MTFETLSFTPMGREHVEGCAKVVAATPFFSEYGFSGEAAGRALTDALSDSRSILWVARSGLQIVGFAWLVKRGAFDRSGYLRLLAVHPEHHRLGVGKRLMETLEGEHLRCGGIALLVTKTNQRACAFYRRLGYEEVGELPDYVKPGTTECIFFKGPVAPQNRR